MLVKVYDMENNEVYIETKAVSYITTQRDCFFVNIKGEMITLDSKNGQELVDIIQRKKDYRVEE